MTRRKIAVAWVALHVLFFTAWSWHEERWVGKDILVQVRRRWGGPSVLGKRIPLQYEFSTPKELGKLGAVPPQGSSVWVVLTKDGEYHVARRVYAERPETVGPGEVLLRGYRRKAKWIDYGIESFYVPEGSPRPHGKLTASLRVAKSGRARLKQLYLSKTP